MVIVNFQLNLDSETVNTLDTGQPRSVATGTSFREAIAHLQNAKTGSLLVTSAGQLCGIVTERDVLRVIAEGQDLDAPVDQYMTTHPVTILASETVGQAIRHMAQGNYRRLPIVDDGGGTIGMALIYGFGWVFHRYIRPPHD